MAAWALVLLSFGLASQLPVRITTEAITPHIPKCAAQALSSYLIVTGLLGSALATAVFLVDASISMAVAALLGLAAGVVGLVSARRS